MENGEIELISDGDGLAVVGDPVAVERFLADEGLPSKELGLPRLGAILGTGAAAAQAGSEIAANSGRWVKLTEESAKRVKEYGLRESSRTGLSTGVIKGPKGRVKGFVEFAKGPGSLLTNPALLAGAAGIMAQFAMQQTMDEVLDYLATIDEKVDDVLRAQKDAVLARMIGIGFVIDEAMILRESRGRVDEVTWSKVQTAPATIAETQAYALRQIDAIAEKLESKRGIGDVAKAAKEAAPKVQEWLAVLARCFQLQDAISVLELDRVLDASPAELDGHRLGLKAARQARLDLISQSTGRLMGRLAAAAGDANTKVLFHPAKSPAIVHSSGQVSTAILDLHGRLGIESGLEPVEARRWGDAATEVGQMALGRGASGVDVVRRAGGEAVGRTKVARDRLALLRAARRHDGEIDASDEGE